MQQKLPDPGALLDEAVNPHRQWSRQPVRREIHVRLNGEPDSRYPLTSPNVYLAVAVRDQGKGRRVVEISLVNAQDEPPANKDTAWLFQPKLAVTTVDTERAAFCPIDDPLEDTSSPDSDPEDRQLRLLYRDRLRHAVGQPALSGVRRGAAPVVSGGRAARIDIWRSRDISRRLGSSDGAAGGGGGG